MSEIPARLSAWRGKMREAGFSVTVVPTGDRHGSEYLAEHDKVRRWLSGFTGSAGTLVVGREEAALFTDGRYFIQAERELQGSGIRLMRMNTPGVPEAEEYAAFLARGGTAGVDFRVISAAWAKAFREKLRAQGAGLADTGDWAEALWADRPPLPSAPAYALEERFTGRPAAEKLAGIRAAAEKAGAQVHIMNALDEICWTLNVRGGDVAYTPVVMSFLLVTEKEALWFVDGSKADSALRADLGKAGVRILPYAEVNTALRSLDPAKRVLLDPERLSEDLFSCIAPGAAVEGKNPAFLQKAVKNETELVNLREIHIRDGLALTRFIYWMKKNAGRIRITESGAAERLLRFRREIPGFVTPSFETICAYGANAAMMHYRAEPGRDAEIAPSGLLLVDSGGQYPMGTTDVTRTFALGQVEEEQKVHFTAVVESVFRLSEATFLSGMSGMKLDVLARGPVWDLMLDYRCGTGHGVGQMLCVHEGPNGFRWMRSSGRSEETELVPGMVTTDEPGIYIEGSHGIRTENELVCRVVGENEYGRFLGFETITCAPIDLDAILPERLSDGTRAALNRYHAFVREKLLPLLMDEAERDWLALATRPV